MDSLLGVSMSHNELPGHLRRFSWNIHITEVNWDIALEYWYFSACYINYCPLYWADICASFTRLIGLSIYHPTSIHDLQMGLDPNSIKAMTAELSIVSKKFYTKDHKREWNEQCSTSLEKKLNFLPNPLCSEHRQTLCLNIYSEIGVVYNIYKLRLQVKKPCF